MHKSPHSGAAPSVYSPPRLACAVIAGGANRRMSGIEKCLLPLGNSSVLGHIMRVLGRANHLVMINANGDLSRFSQFSQPKVEDSHTHNGHTESAGPISGIIACLIWLQRHYPNLQWLLTSAGDTPFLPDNYVDVFARHIATQRAQVFFAAYRGQAHYLNCAWHLSTATPLVQQKARGRLSIKGALDLFEHREVDFSHCAQDPFFNINTPKDYAVAKGKLL